MIEKAATTTPKANSTTLDTRVAIASIPYVAREANCVFKNPLESTNPSATSSKKSTHLAEKG